MSSSPDPLAALVDRARAGDREAASALLEQLQPMLRGFFARRTGGRDAVDDLLQNTLVRVHRGLADLKEPGSLRAFAMKAALFELQDFYRGRYAGREASLPEDAEHPAAPAGAPGLAIDLERALSTLAPRARRIMELKAMGYRYEEIAAMIDSTEAAVKMQVKRAVERLRQLLAVLAWLALHGGLRP